jgi:predicted Rossmann fold flavoprotein
VARCVRKDGSFELETNQGSFMAPALVVATGGLSIPTLGATDFGYRLARQFGLRVLEPRPALVPFTLAPQVLDRLATLSGVSLDALVGCRGKEFRENILVTHRGLSGPAILQISSYWRPGEPVSINLLPDEDAVQLLSGEQDREVELVNLLARHLPRRFAQAWCELYAPSKRLKHYDGREIQDVARKLHEMRITPSGTEGFRKAEVTAGGVSTAELSSRTMEAARVPGLYFIGEVVDVTGQLGGFNFQWAWASGHAAGQHV